ncbi:hypothetical protein ACFROC_22915 [Nocardia tengchongensis]|uniref:hypothetical protein n=1 Tax=Nocardia tengchongensis TaxID=2055889 RepID=UPI0036C7078A
MDTQTRPNAGTVRTARTVVTSARRAARRATATMLTAARRHGPALAALALRPAAWLTGIAAVVLIGLAVAPPVVVTLGCTPAPLAAATAASDPNAQNGGTAPGCVMFCQDHQTQTSALVGGLLHAAA